MSNAVRVSYSKHSGKRVTDRFATNNPNYVESFVFIEGTVPVEFLKRGQTLPSNIVQARAADEARKAAAAKVEAEAAAKKATKAAKKVGKKAAKKTPLQKAKTVLKKAEAKVKKTSKALKKAVAAEKAAKKSRIVKRNKDGEFAKKTSSCKTDFVAAPKTKKQPGAKVAKKIAKKAAVKKVVPASIAGLTK